MFSRQSFACALAFVYAFSGNAAAQPVPIEEDEVPVQDDSKGGDKKPPEQKPSEQKPSEQKPPEQKSGEMPTPPKPAPAPRRPAR